MEPAEAMNGVGGRGGIESKCYGGWKKKGSSLFRKDEEGSPNASTSAVDVVPRCQSSAIGFSAPPPLVEDEGVEGVICGRYIYSGDLDFAAAQTRADELNG